MARLMAARRPAKRPVPRSRTHSKSTAQRGVERAAAQASLLRHRWTRPVALLLAATVALGALLSPGNWLELTLGVAGPLLPLWLFSAGCASIPRPTRWRPSRQFVAGAGSLSIALPALLALFHAGGMLGGGLFWAAEALVGRSGTVFVLLLLAAGGSLLMLGSYRERIALAFLDLMARRSGAEHTARAEATSRPASRAARTVQPEPNPTAQPASPNAEATQPKPELLIVGAGEKLASASPRSRARASAAPSPSSALLPEERGASPTPPLPHSPAPEAPTRPLTRSPARELSPAPHWALPSLELLSLGKSAAVSADDLKAQAKVIEETLETFRLPVRVVEVRPGPVLSLYAVEPGPGVAVDRIAARAHDLALRLGARTVRVQVPIPGRTLMGIEVPHGETSLVTLRETLESATHKEMPALPVALGKDVSGQAVVVDLARLPHLLIAGATGSGKSVGLNTLLASLLLTRTPEDVKFILIDPKRVELIPYTGVPHLRMPVVTDMERVLGALRWALSELESRFSRFAAATCRNLEAYNQRRGGERLPRLVIVIDELADLMMTVPDEVERCLVRLAQLGRAAGIHLVIATQRPSVDVLTGLIKANFPARIAFAVSSLMDSRVVLDTAGAEQLLGRGDMLYQAPDAGKPRRVQGAYVEERELREVVSHWRRQGAPTFSPAEEDELASLGREALADPEDELFARAQQLASEHDKITASFLQRRLNIGYPKAARLMQRLQQEEADGEEEEA